ncbi:sulfurtransferase complex subunit TusB [Hahella ganghwensis]|uniref:sulfurtransferase complex subunit TusB n=1 Tax=Hahella ganghwensis TaxID=286420 RepID=UPI0003635638|nr:sulfurtransferase complex subunit TusB [Hahella ganghwensis]
MMTLHIFNQGTHQTELLNKCLESLTPGDTLLFIEDGVIWTTSSPFDRLNKRLKVTGIDIYTLSEDISARGLESLRAETVQMVDYPGFVSLTEKHNHSISWF